MQARCGTRLRNGARPSRPHEKCRAARGIRERYYAGQGHSQRGEERRRGTPRHGSCDNALAPFQASCAVSSLQLARNGGSGPSRAPVSALRPEEGDRLVGAFFRRSGWRLRECASTRSQQPSVVPSKDSKPALTSAQRPEIRRAPWLQGCN